MNIQSVRSYASSASIQAGVVTQVIGAVVDVQVSELLSLFYLPMTIYCSTFVSSQIRPTFDIPKKPIRTNKCGSRPIEVYF